MTASLVAVTVDAASSAGSTLGAEPSRFAPKVDSFPLGVFEDANILGGDTSAFKAMGKDLLSRGFDSVFFANNALDRDSPFFDVADQLDLGIFYAPTWEFDRDWWPSQVPATTGRARVAISPVVNRLRSHRSLKGYSVVDEPTLSQERKLSLVTQAFRDLDPSRPAMPTLVGIDRVGAIVESISPDVLLIDVYPVGRDNATGDFRMTGFGYPDLDFVSYVRLVTRNKPKDVPLWMVLQAHDYRDGGKFGLRKPKPAEVRAENWLAIGEGATGIFWFIYSSQPSWTGLKDNQPLFGEVSSLARRLSALRGTLLNARRGDATFTTSANGMSYVSTLTSLDGSRLYAVVVNRDCERGQKLLIDAPGFQGQLKDLETSNVYPLGTAVQFAPGDGKVFELIGAGLTSAHSTAAPTPDPSPAPDPTPEMSCAG